MEYYQLTYILHEPCEEHGWLYRAEVLELPGCNVWGDTASATLAELPIVAEQFILSYKDTGDPLPEGLVRSQIAEGRISVAV